MNKRLHCIVFNRRRGQLVAVSELTSSEQARGRSRQGAQSLNRLLMGMKKTMLTSAIALAMGSPWVSNGIAQTIRPIGCVQNLVSGGILT